MRYFINFLQRSRKKLPKSKIVKIKNNNETTVKMQITKNEFLIIIKM